MARTRGDVSTLDLLKWQPPEAVVERYEEVQVRAASIGAKISKAVSRTLCDAKDGQNTPISRAEVSGLMGSYLGTDVSKDVLDAYAAESRESHNISLVRTMGLMHATQDYRLLALIADELGLAVIPKNYEPVLRVAILKDHMEEMQREIDSLGGGRVR